MGTPENGLYAALVELGMSRRAFLRFTTAVAATLALPPTLAPRIAAAIEAAPRLPVIWLRGQSCGGNTQAFLAANDPPVTELLLDLLSIEYHESLMARSGPAATRARTDAMARYPDGYLAIVEGAIPTVEDGMACTVGGRTIREVVEEVCAGAAATIAVGSCAFDGGAPGAGGGPTGAVGVGSITGEARLVNLPGCPVNVENLVATIVHFMTFRELPPTGSMRRPLFAYGGLLHNQCERRGHYEFGEFALAWGDEGAQKGWCLYKLGCKGPETFANCPTALYADRTSWAVKAGHGCIGCTMPDFWDSMGPAYSRLPSPLPFAPGVTSDQLGLGLVGAIGGVTAAHAAATYAREIRNGFVRRRRTAEAAAVAEPPTVAEPATAPAASPIPAPAGTTPLPDAPTPPRDEPGAPA